jgi:hypothetical protein
VSDLERDFAVQLTAIAVIVLVSLAAALVLPDREPWRFRLDAAASCLAVGAALAIVVVTVTPRGNRFNHGGIQLVPLRTLRSYAHDPSDLLIYLVGNVALFVPLGFFLYLAMRHFAGTGQLVVTTVICAQVSLGVEILQLPIWSRSSDIDDIITNTAGAFVGALAAYVLLNLTRAVWVGGPGPIRHVRDA